MDSPAPHFDGPDLLQDRDAPRLTEQLKRIFGAMAGSQWRTLSELAELTGDPPASVSARLRDFRKPKFGEWIVEKEYIRNGLYRYRIKGRKARGQLTFL